MIENETATTALGYMNFSAHTALVANSIFVGSG